MQYASFGLGTGPILLQDVNCTGGEANLLQCHAHSRGANSVCKHSEDVSVICPCMQKEGGGGGGDREGVG